MSDFQTDITHVHVEEQVMEVPLGMELPPVSMEQPAPILQQELPQDVQQGVHDLEIQQQQHPHDISKVEIPQYEVPQTELPQHDFQGQHELPQHQISQHELPQHELVQHELPQHEMGLPQHENEHVHEHGHELGMEHHQQHEHDASLYDAQVHTPQHHYQHPQHYMDTPEMQMDASGQMSPGMHHTFHTTTFSSQAISTPGEARPKKRGKEPEFRFTQLTPTGASQHPESIKRRKTIGKKTGLDAAKFTIRETARSRRRHRKAALTRRPDWNNITQDERDAAYKAIDATIKAEIATADKEAEDRFAYFVANRKPGEDDNGIDDSFQMPQQNYSPVPQMQALEAEQVAQAQQPVMIQQAIEVSAIDPGLSGEDNPIVQPIDSIMKGAIAALEASHEALPGSSTAIEAPKEAAAEAPVTEQAAAPASTLDLLGEAMDVDQPGVPLSEQHPISDGPKLPLDYPGRASASAEPSSGPNIKYVKRTKGKSTPAPKPITTHDLSTPLGALQHLIDQGGYAGSPVTPGSAGSIFPQARGQKAVIRFDPLTPSGESTHPAAFKRRRILSKKSGLEAAKFTIRETARSRRRNRKAALQKTHEWLSMSQEEKDIKLEEINERIKQEIAAADKLAEDSWQERLKEDGTPEDGEEGEEIDYDDVLDPELQDEEMLDDGEEELEAATPAKKAAPKKTPAKKLTPKKKTPAKVKVVSPKKSPAKVPEVQSEEPEGEEEEDEEAAEEAKPRLADVPTVVKYTPRKKRIRMQKSRSQAEKEAANGTEPVDKANVSPGPSGSDGGREASDEAAPVGEEVAESSRRRSSRAAASQAGSDSAPGFNAINTSGSRPGTADDAAEKGKGKRAAPEESGDEGDETTSRRSGRATKKKAQFDTPSKMKAKADGEEAADEDEGEEAGEEEDAEDAGKPAKKGAKAAKMAKERPLATPGTRRMTRGRQAPDAEEGGEGAEGADSNWSVSKIWKKIF